MPQPGLDHLIDQWARTLEAAEPRLRQHLDEIKDHVRTKAQARIDAGAGMSDAFAAAIGAFGAPRELASEYLKSAVYARDFALKVAGAALVATLVVTTEIVAVDEFTRFDVKWLGVGFTWVVILSVVALFFVRPEFREEV